MTICRSSKLNAALGYAKKGLSVIPMAGKRPIIQFAERSALTETEIIEIWTEFPTANVAVNTTSFFVVDVDVHNGAKGIESFRSMPREWFENTLVQRTASGGYHYFFMKPKNIEIKQSINFLEGIDIKAHDNNYVLFSPSEINGNKYEFLNKKPIASPPKGLIEFILSKQKSDFDAKIQNYSTDKTQTTKLFEMIANGLGDAGGRNDALTKFCGGLLFRNVEPEEVFKLALIANNNTPNPLNEKEVYRTVKSMINKEIRRRRDMIE